MGSKQAIVAGHLARKIQHTVGRREQLARDLLSQAGVETTFCGATGFPEAADSVAYDPAQGLLAVGTSDGRVVLIGRPGVEVTLRSASRSPTQHLCFLPNKGALLRVTKDGDIQLFSAVQRRLLTSTWLQGDVINSVAVLPSSSDPYVLLGCESGNVRIVAILDAEGRPAAGARPAADLALQPYQVLGQEVGGEGSVVAVAVAHQRPDQPLLLVVHRDSGALVWDIRAERILCSVMDEGVEGSKPTCACWVGDRASCFAVGYDDGSVRVHGTSSDVVQADSSTSRYLDEPTEAPLLMPLRVAGRGVHAAPVRSLSFLPSGPSSSGSGGGGGGRGGARGASSSYSSSDCLLVFGGQGKEEPDMLTLLPLAAQDSRDSGGRQVPWFGNIQGFCMMSGDGAAAAAQQDNGSRGLMILTEGGQLVIHDLTQWQPTPLTLPIQELPPITVASLVPTVSAALLWEGSCSSVGGTPAVQPPTALGTGSSGQPSPSPRGGEAPTAGGMPRQQQQSAGPVQHALTLERVRASSRRSSQGPGSSLEAALPEHWPFTGGQPACSLAGGGEGAAAGAKRHPSALYFSGHRDGRVRVWDATMQVPELLLTIPMAAGQERLRAVTAMEVDPFSGLVIVGHAGGDVRLYQFTDAPQTVHRMNIDETLLPYENVGLQPAGFQYILRYSTHSTDITAVALASKLKLAAVADESGTLSLLDLLQPSQLFSTRVMPQAVVQAAFGSHVIPGAKDEMDVERVMLFLAGSDSSLCMVGLDAGEPVGHVMRPKNASRPLALTLLDGSGIPLPLLHGQLVLAWANNNTPAASPPGQATAARVGSIKEADGRASRLSLSERTSSVQSPVPPGDRSASRRSTGVASTGADSHRSWSRADSEHDMEREGSVEVHELPSDDDLDAHLAAAVHAADEEKRQAGRGKFKLPKAFHGLKHKGGAGGGPGEGGEADLPSPTNSDQSAFAARAGEAAHDLIMPLHDFAGAQPASPTSPAPSSPDAALGQQPRGSGAGTRLGAAGGNGELLSQADLVDYQYLVDGDPTPAAYVLLCCDDYLRLYAADNIRLGDRSTERKASFEAPLCFAASFMSTHGPGVVSVDTSDALQVHSLPSLELLTRKQLEDSRVLGFRWACAAPDAASPGAACCSMDGQLVLAAAGNEIARLAVVEDCTLPAPPAAVYDMRAAQAAATARSTSGGGSSMRVDLPGSLQQPLGPGGEVGFSPLAAAAVAGKGFGRLLDHAAATVTGLATSAAGSMAQEFQRLGVGGSAGPLRPLPSLQALFATPVEAVEGEEEEEELDFMDEHEEPSASAAPSQSAAAAAAFAAASDARGASAVPGIGSQARARKLGGSMVSPRDAAAKLKQLLPVGRSKSERAELLERDAAAATAAVGAGSTSARGAAGGSAGGAGAGGSNWAATGKKAPINRSASEIKRTYGRSGGACSGGASSRAGEVRGIMEQNREMLAERGERLRNLDERTAAMSNDAGDFASMAKKLADMQANKKWYQL